MKTYGRAKEELHACLTSALERGQLSVSRPGTDWIGGRLGPMDAVAKRKKNTCLCRESNSGRPTRNLDTILTELSWLLEKK
jgi:hypothetical protein